MKKILLLTDFSEASRQAIRYARSFFSETSADMHLVCAHPVETDQFYSPKHMTETAHTAFKDLLHDLVVELRQENKTPWHSFRSTARPGSLLTVVQEILNAECYDYVVLGAKKDGTNELFGNSATTLVRQLETNVLIVPTDTLPGPVRKVVLAADFASLKNIKLLGTIKELATLKQATLTLLTVDTPGKQVNHASEEVRLRQFMLPVQPITVHVQAPNAREGITEYALNHPCDLLVTIPHHKSWTNALAGTSVTRSLAYNPAVPLLTLYDDGKSDYPPVVEDLDLDVFL